VRAEEKELEGPELEREERTRDEAEIEEEELPVASGEELVDVELRHRSTLFDALRLVMAGENVNVSLLYLPQRETHALEALQAAVNGQDSVGEFVFAEDRRALLEQALAVLQQNVTHGDPAQLAELHAKFDELTGQVGELRERLTSLEDAQEDLIEEKNEQRAREAADEGDKDDKPADTAAAAAQPAQPAQPAYDPAAPERPAAPVPPSTLYGDAAPEPAPGPSTAYDPAAPERPEGPVPPSSLYGEAPAELERGKSELAAEAEEEEAKNPWWSRWLG
jgi:TolA-binding protein